MAMRDEVPIESEAHLVSLFCQEVERLNNERNAKRKWTIYHETAGWDLLLVDDTGVQIGIEAKMSLNVKVLTQALPQHYSEDDGPDYRAVLVAGAGVQKDIGRLAGYLGLTVLHLSMSRWHASMPISIDMTPRDLPDEMSRSLYSFERWHAWHPRKRLALPDYLPDVEGGKAAPLMLTDWKIRAIKLVILLDRRGHVTRKDMAHLKISPTRWTAWNGYLKPGETRGQYVRSGITPDFKAQHPTNYAQIEADWEKWKPADEA